MTPDCKQMHVLENHNTADSIHCCSRLPGLIAHSLIINAFDFIAVLLLRENNYYTYM